MTINRLPQSAAATFLGRVACLCLWAAIGALSPAAAQQFQQVDPNVINPEQRRVTQLIAELRESPRDASMDSVESFDTAWELSTRGEDPKVGSRDQKRLEFGQHEVDSGARAQLTKLFESRGETFRERYEEFVGPKAERALKLSLRDGDLSDLHSLVLRFQFTAAGQSALRNLVTLRMSRGETLQAAIEYDRLLRLLRDDSARGLLASAKLWYEAGLPEEAIRPMTAAVEKHAGKQASLNGKTYSVPEGLYEISDWLAASFGPFDATESDLWLQPNGNYRRTQTTSTGPPAVRPVWNVSSFECAECVDCVDPDEINNLLKGLDQIMRANVQGHLKAGDTAWPAAVPLLTRNLVVFRAAAKLRAVDRQTGELVWESTLIDRKLNAVMERWRRDFPESSSGSARARVDFANGLFGHLVRSNVNGQLSTDGKLLFAIEGASTETLNLSDNRDMQALTPTNFLRAYDIETGVLRGQAGGSRGLALEGGRTNPLAGMYFLGAPLVLGDRIYCMAENGQGIYLLRLRAIPLYDKNGQVELRVLDSQLLSEPSFLLRQHPARKYAGLTPTFIDGLLICSTCDEQIVAVSVDDHSVRWNHRYRDNVARPELGRNVVLFGNSMNTQMSGRLDLAARWTDNLVRVQGDRVYLTPRDSDRLHCLDLHTGRQIWTRPREGFRGIAHLSAERLVLVGLRSITSLNPETGERIWQTELDDQTIAGRAICSDRVLQVTTNQPALLTFDVATGRRLLQQHLPPGAIGNLLTDGQQTYIQSLTDVTAVGLANAPASPVDATRNLLLAGDVVKATEQLEELQASSDATIATEAKGLYIETMLDNLKADFPRYQDRLGELRQLIADTSLGDETILALSGHMLDMTLGDAVILPDAWRRIDVSRRRTRMLNRLIAERLSIDMKAPAEDIAARMFQLLSEAVGETDQTLSLGDTVLASDRIRIGAVDQALQRFAQPKSDDVRQRLAQQVEAILLETDDADRRQWWCEAALTLRLALFIAPETLRAVRLPAVSQAACRNLLLEQHLDLASERSVGNQQTRGAIKLLAEHWAETQRADDWARLQARTRMWHDNGGQEFLSPDLIGSSVSTDFVLPISTEEANRSLPFPGKPSVDVNVYAPGVNTPGKLKQESIHVELPIFNTGGEFARWALTVSDVSSDITAYDDVGRCRWTIPRPASQSVNDRQLRTMFNRLTAHYAVARGSLLLVKFGAVVSMYDCSEATPEKPPIRLWSQDLTAIFGDPSDSQWRTPAWQRTTVYDLTLSGLYPVGPISADVVPLYLGRELLLMDTLTGRELVRTSGLPEDCQLSLKNNRLLVISPSQRQVESRSLVTGEVIQVAPLPAWWSDAEENFNASVYTSELAPGDAERYRLALINGNYITLKRTTEEATLECHDLASGLLAYSMELPPDTLASNVTDQHVALLTNGNVLRLVNLSSGRIVSREDVEATPECMFLYLRVSGGNWLVLTDEYYEDYYEYNPVNDSVPVGGHMYAISEGTGKLAWQKKLPREFLRIRLPTQSAHIPSPPVLLLQSRPDPPRPPGGGRGRVFYHCVIYDTRTGEEIHREPDVGTNISYHMLQPDAANGTITIGYNDRSIMLKYGSEPKPKD